MNVFKKVFVADSVILSLIPQIDSRQRWKRLVKTMETLKMKEQLLNKVEYIVA